MSGWTEICDVGRDGDRLRAILPIFLIDDHPNISKPYKILLERDEAGERILTLYFSEPECVSLHEFLKGEIGFEVRVELARQLLQTVQFLHDRKLAHNLMTTDNIFVKCTSEGPVLKLAALHTCNSVSRPCDNYNCVRNYRPPEVIVCATSDSISVDTWVVGCVLFEICNSREAIPSCKQIR